MNILVSGDLSCLTTTLVKEFLKERYKLVLVSNALNETKFDLRNITVHSISPAADYFQDIVSAHKFDMVIYLATREEQLLHSDRQNAGNLLDGLLNTLELCRKEGIKNFFYISSTEVYGSQDFLTEENDPNPTFPNGYTINTGERYCQYYSEHYGLHPTVIRVPFIYGQGEKSNFLHDLIKKFEERKKVVFPGRSETICNFLHAEDVTNFILKALDLPATGFQIYNLSSTDSVTFGQLAGFLHARFPSAKYEFDTSKKIYTLPASAGNAKRTFDWIAEHKLFKELPKVIDEICAEPKPKEYLIEKIKGRFPKFQFYLKWAEVFLGALVMHYLSSLSGSVIEFRYVDFRLAYVILLGIVYGTQVGLIASAFASLSILLIWSTQGLDWIELLYNVSNWLPFAMYITAGVITGYFHDKQENDLRAQDEQITLIKDKYKFLYDLYQEVSQLKNQFHKQLVGSRDSFGRIFKISQELDTLEEEEVIFKATHILEDVMDNNHIAIYSIHQASRYARLEIYSSSLSGKLKKSLDLRDYPDLVKSVENGEPYQNRMVKQGYPAYFVPITNETTTVAAVVIWNAGFDQLSLYYFNLLKVICGLIQSSINRVALFMDANIHKYYIPNTRILKPEPFEKVLKVKNKMKKNKLGDYLLVKVLLDYRLSGPHVWENLYTQISGVTRAEDYVGMLENGNCYILFSQADQTNMDTILSRLAQRGITCQCETDLYPTSPMMPGHMVSPESPTHEAAVRSVSGSPQKTGPLFTFDPNKPLQGGSLTNPPSTGSAGLSETGPLSYDRWASNTGEAQDKSKPQKGEDESNPHLNGA